MNARKLRIVRNLIIAACIILLSLGLIIICILIRDSNAKNIKTVEIAQEKPMQKEGTQNGGMESDEDPTVENNIAVDENIEVDENVAVGETPDCYLYCSDIYKNFKAEWFKTEWEMTLGERKSPILKETDLDAVQILLTENKDIKILFLEIDPQMASSEKAKAIYANFPNVMFYLFFPVHNVSFWVEPINNGPQLEKQYRISARALLSINNVYSFSFYKQAWLICNKNNYDASGYLSEDACLELFHAFNNHKYLLCTEEDIRTPIPKIQHNNAFLRNTNGFIFGDSIWGLEKNSTGIADILSGMNGMNIINCAAGGSTATYTLPTKDTSQEETGHDLLTQIDQMMMNYLSIYPDYVFLEFGLNDYFQQQKIEDSTDKMNIHTFKGAIRTAIGKIRARYPTTQIIILGPSTVYLYEFGKQNMERQGTLEDYEEALIQIAQEYEIPIQLNLDTDEFAIDNMASNLKADNCHLNEMGRYIYAKRLDGFLRKTFKEEK